MELESGFLKKIGHRTKDQARRRKRQDGFAAAN
jgi:hypothetical protein